MSITTDKNDKQLQEKKDNGQNKSYLVLSRQEIDKGFIRPLRYTYIHKACGGVTTIAAKIAETYAREPKLYASTFCYKCRNHFPVGEFIWDGTDEVVGS